MRLGERDEPGVRAEGLAKRFGAVRALESVDLEVPRGSTLAMLGPNGAGKTTTVRILSTLLPPDGGRAWICGLDVVREPAAVRRRIGLSGQYAAVDNYLTGRENVRMIARLSGLGRHEARRRTDEVLERVDLGWAANRLVRTYSAGMRRRVDIAASLVGAPSVLFLDEPTSGLDPHGRIAVWELLDELTARGASLLLTTQDMEEAERLADRVVVIGRGRVIATGRPEELKAQVGGYRLELRARAEDDTGRLADALAGWGDGRPLVDLTARRVTLPVDDGLALLPELVARLDAEGLSLADLALRRPSLDEAFLTLTGRLGRDSVGTNTATHDPRPEVDAVGAANGQDPRDGASAAEPPTPPASTLSTVGIITGRNVRRLLRVPTLIAFASVQPALFVLLFTYVFGGAVDPRGVSHYIDYVLPGLFVLAIGFGASQTGVAVADDLATGMIDRFRSLPIAGAAALAGRAVADALRNVFVVVLMIALGSALGFRFHAGPAAAVAAVGLAVAAGLAFSWINLLIGLVVRDAEAAGLAGLFPVIILVFTSSTLVPLVSMPGWLQAVARVNPITVIVDALRALTLGAPATRPVLRALAWIVGLLVFAVAAAIRRYRRTTGA